MAPYQPAPPPSSPFDWGDDGRVRELLGEWFELELEEYVSTLHDGSSRRPSPTSVDTPSGPWYERRAPGGLGTVLVEVGHDDAQGRVGGTSARDSDRLSPPGESPPAQTRHTT